MAKKLQLSLAFGVNPRVQPLFDGTVEIDGVELICNNLTAGEIFWRQLHFQQFDISEMSISSLIIATSQGQTDWVGLPIFTTRRFFHTGILVRVDAEIDKPEDLKGKRVGVSEYQQTAALWCRGALQHEFGVAPQDVEWFMERSVELSHGGATGFTPPDGVRLTYIPPEKNIGQMMVDGELDVALFYNATGVHSGSILERSVINLANHPRVKRLFPDPIAESARYYQKTGIYPFNHTVILRRSLAEQYPWLPLNVLEAFQKAKQIGEANARYIASPYVEAGLLPADARKALAQDLYPYGIQANRSTIETAMAYSTEQGLTPRRLAPEEVYAESTMQQ